MSTETPMFNLQNLSNKSYVHSSDLNLGVQFDASEREKKSELVHMHRLYNMLKDRGCLTLLTEVGHICVYQVDGVSVTCSSSDGTSTTTRIRYLYRRNGWCMLFHCDIRGKTSMIKDTKHIYSIGAHILTICDGTPTKLDVCNVYQKLTAQHKTPVSILDAGRSLDRTYNIVKTDIVFPDRTLRYAVSVSDFLFGRDGSIEDVSYDINDRIYSSTDELVVWNLDALLDPELHYMEKYCSSRTMSIEELSKKDNGNFVVGYLEDSGGWVYGYSKITDIKQCHVSQVLPYLYGIETESGNYTLMSDDADMRIDIYC